MVLENGGGTGGGHVLTAAVGILAQTGTTPTRRRVTVGACRLLLVSCCRGCCYKICGISCCCRCCCCERIHGERVPEEGRVEVVDSWEVGGVLQGCSFLELH